MKKIAVFLMLILLQFSSYAQCAMCKATVESGGTEGESLASGLNTGILYLMFIPYLLIGSIAFFIYRHKKKQKQAKGA